MADFQIPENEDDAVKADNRGEKETDGKNLAADEAVVEVLPQTAQTAQTGTEDTKAPCPLEDTDCGKDEADTDESDGNLLLKSILELGEKMDRMNLLFTQKIQRTAHEEKIVDRMHAELQKYKDDMYAQLVRPILLDIIEIRESIRRVSASYASKPEEERAVPLKTFSDYTYDLQDILEKNNISIFDSQEGDDFNALKNRAIKKITTSQERLHGKVAESLGSGYEYMGKTISPEKVAVYIYQKSENTEGED